MTFQNMFMRFWLCRQMLALTRAGMLRLSMSEATLTEEASVCIIRA